MPIRSVRFVSFVSLAALATWVGPLGCASPPEPEDVAEESSAVGIASNPPPPTALPAAVDHGPFQTDIRNQGQRGTCVSFALTAALEAIAVVKHGMPRSRHLSIEPYAEGMPAERIVVAGVTFLEPYLEAIQGERAKLPWEEHWPYQEPTPRARPASYNWVMQVRRMTALPATNVTALKRVLAADDAANILLSVDEDLGFAPDGVVFRNPNRRGSRLVGNHAILLVGYGPLPARLRRPGDGPTFFKAKNSWGTGWGDGGYWYLSTDYLQTHGKAASFIAEYTYNPAELGTRM